MATYLASGPAALTVSQDSTSLIVHDPAENISLTPDALQGGCTPEGSNTVRCSSNAVSHFQITTTAGGTVTVKPSGLMAQIQITFVHLPPALVVDDSNDSNPTLVNLGNNGVGGTLTSTVYVITPDGPQPFQAGPVLFPNGLQSLTVLGGSGENTFTVAGTGDIPTTLVSGAGQDAVHVLGTNVAGPLVIDGQDGHDTVTLGQGASPLGLFPGVPLATIQGRVSIDNANSQTDLVLDDSADTFPAQLILSNDQIQSSVAAKVTFTPAHIASVTVNGGGGGNVFTINQTTASLAVPTTLNTGHADQVKLSQVAAPLEVFDADASAQIMGTQTPYLRHVIVRAPLVFNTSTTGVLDSATDVDLYPMHVLMGGLLDVSAMPSAGSLLDPGLGLYNIPSYIHIRGLPTAGGGLLLTSDNQVANNPTASVSIYLLPGEPTFPNEYFLAVSSAGLGGGAYTLSAHFNPEPNPLAGLDMDPALTREVGNNPVALVDADFNNDGVLDLATANHDSGTVSVLLGVGDGSFELHKDFKVGGHPDGLVAVDYNNDGIPDLLVRDSTAGIVTVLPGLGDGGFSELPIAQLSLANRTVAALFPTSQLSVTADFNRDGYPDTATLNSSGTGTPGHIELDRGLPAALPASIDTPLGTYPVSLFLKGVQQVPANSITSSPAQSMPLQADLNGDRTLDEVTVSRAGDILVRYAIPGQTGVFDAPVVANDKEHPVQSVAIVATGAETELAAIEYGTNTIALYKRQVGGQWVRSEGPPTGLSPTQIFAADLNGDGYADLVVANNFFGLASLSVYHGEADGSFTYVSDLNVGTDISDVILTDINGDGVPDIVVTNADAGEVGVLLHRGLPGTIAFQDEQPLRAGAGMYGVKESVATPVANESVPSADFPPLYFPISNEETDSVAVGDFTGDRVMDLVVTNRGSNTFAILRGKAGPFGSYVDPQIFRAGDRPIAVCAADFNGDHHLDLAILNAGNSTVSIFLGDGQGHFSLADTVSAGSSPTGLAVQDVNGKEDLLISNVFGDLLTLVSNGNGTFQPPYIPGNRVPLAVQTMGPGGQPEVLLSNQQTGQVFVQTRLPGSTQFVPVASLNTPGQTTVLAPGAVEWSQLEGSSRPLYDAVVIGTGSNDVLVYHALGFNALGQPVFAPPQTYTVGTNPVGVTIEDINGDGIPDMIVSNQGSNDVSILFGGYDAAGNWIAKPGPRYQSDGLGPVSTTVMDLTEDGIPDLVVTNGASGTLTVLPGRGQGFFDDRAAMVLNVPGNPGLLPSVIFPSGSGVVPTADGRLIGLSLNNFNASVQTVFTSADGVNGVAALSDTELVLADATGALALLRFNLVTQHFDALGDLTPLTGIPSDPSALAVLESETGTQVLVTSAGQDQVFVFAIGPPDLSVPLPAPAPLAEATAPADQPLTLVVALVGINLPTGEAEPPEAPVQPGGDGEADEEPSANPPDSSASEIGPDVEDALRSLDLYRRPEMMPPFTPLSQSDTSLGSETMGTLLAALQVGPGQAPSDQNTLWKPHGMRDELFAGSIGLPGPLDSWESVGDHSNVDLIGVKPSAKVTPAVGDAWPTILHDEGPVSHRYEGFSVTNDPTLRLCLGEPSFDDRLQRAEEEPSTEGSWTAHEILWTTLSTGAVAWQLGETQRRQQRPRFTHPALPRMPPSAP
jgi:hypothetical protein